MTHPPSLPRRRASGAPGRVRPLLPIAALLVLGIAATLLLAGLRALPGGDLLVRVDDARVGVRIDYWDGSQTPVSTPGYQVVLPQLGEVRLLDKSPVELVLGGSELVDPAHTPQLIVRASDGSSFWFNRVSVRYGVDPARLEVALSALPAEDPHGYRLASGYARSILRDELGRYDPEGIVLPENLQVAVARAEERLDAALDRHGLEVYEIAVSKPSFDPQYEATIERAKVAEQELEGLDHKAFILDANQEARLEQVRQKKALALQKARATWEQQLLSLQKDAERLEAGQEEKLARLRRYQELTLEKSRAKWSRELEVARQKLVEAERKAEQQQVALTGTKELELEKQRAEWDRELARLEDEARRAQEERELHLSELRRVKELELAEARAKWQGELQTLDAELAKLDFETDAYCASRTEAGRLERERQLAQAEVLSERYREEAALLAARSEALAEHGLSAVRAALIDKLASISFQIVPSSQEERAGASSVASNRPSDR